MCSVISAVHSALGWLQDQPSRLPSCEVHGCLLSGASLQWRDDASLELTRKKTKETMLTFSSKQMELTEESVCTIHRQAVEMLEEYKYLGTTFDSTLKFTSNSKDTLRKCQQQQYLLRKLNSFGISKEIPWTLYWTLIGSLLTFSIICWYNVIDLQ